MMAQVKILSLLRSEMGVSYLVLDHPVIHIILYPDGTTNQPEPKVKQDLVEQLARNSFFALVHRTTGSSSRRIRSGAIRKCRFRSLAARCVGRHELLALSRPL